MRIVVDTLEQRSDESVTAPRLPSRRSQDFSNYGIMLVCYHVEILTFQIVLCIPA